MKEQAWEALGDRPTLATMEPHQLPSKPLHDLSLNFVIYKVKELDEGPPKQLFRNVKAPKVSSSRLLERSKKER